LEVMVGKVVCCVRNGNAKRDGGRGVWAIERVCVKHVVERMPRRKTRRDGVALCVSGDLGAFCAERGPACACLCTFEGLGGETSRDIEDGYVHEVKKYIDCCETKRNQGKQAYNSDIGRVFSSLNPGVALETDMTSQKIYTHSYRTALSYSRVP
jgi:hypothetical protein